MASNEVAFWVSGITGLAVIVLCIVAYYETVTTGEEHIPHPNYLEPLTFLTVVAFIMGLLLTAF